MDSKKLSSKKTSGFFFFGLQTRYPLMSSDGTIDMTECGLPADQETFTKKDLVAVLETLKQVREKLLSQSYSKRN
jgi:hypothetical protein